MTMRRRTAPIPLILAVAALAGCASAPTGNGPAPAAATTGSAAERAEMEALFRERQQQARMRFTEADVHFMTGMIAHHAQAVLMSRMAETRDAGPQLRVLAARIRAGQEDEIRLMQQWLRERGQPVPEVHYESDRVMLHGGGHHMAHHHGMPGMLTDEQLAELARNRGAEFDRLFLVFMIEHHNGAVYMVDELMAADGAAQDPTIFRLASDIKVEQVAEISRMQQMLARFIGRD